MKYPKITIVTPSLNQVKYIEATIKSVLDQNYPNLEYIIIDGGSTDGAVDIIRKYEKQLSYWVSEQDSGLYHAIQKGFDRSSGEIMAWLNSDDMLQPGSLFVIAEIFNSFSQIQWIQGIPSFYDETGRTVAVGPARQWCKADFHTLNYKWIQQESVFWRRDLWLEAGSKLDTNYKLAGDFDLWLRFFQYAELYTTDALLSGFRIRKENQLSLDFSQDYDLEVSHALAVSRKSWPDEYTQRIDEFLNFNKKIADTKNRILRSIYFRFNYGRIKDIEKELFQYPRKLYFNRLNQKFSLGS